MASRRFSESDLPRFDSAPSVILIRGEIDFFVEEAASKVADAFVAERRDASRIVGAAVADPAQAVGRVARRMLPAGAVLASTDLVAQRLIRRGDNVALVSRRGGVEVRVAGKALADAGENERVTVENLSSRRVVQGIVGAAGDVWVSR